MAPPRRETPDPLTYSRQGDSTLLRPQAAPVDTFIRTAAPLKSPLNDLAESLASIRPALDRFLYQKADELSAEERKKAEADAMVATAKSWDEAIQKGEVTAGSSPLYRRVYEETLGKIEGLNTAQTQLWQAWVSPENTIRTTQDPAVIAGWFNDQRKKLLDGKSPDVAKGMAPALLQVQQQLTQRIISDNVKAIEQGNHDALGQLFMDRILAGTQQGQSPAQIAAQLADDALPHRFAGMQGKEINTIAAKAIIAVAQKTGNSALLQVGYADRPDVKNPGQMLRGVFTIPEFATAADSARTSILSRQNAEANRAMIAEARAEKVEFKNVMTEIMTKKLEDPNYEPPKELLLRGVKANPDFMSHYRTQVRAVSEPKPEKNFQAYSALYSEYIDKVRRGEDATPLITRMIDTGAITSSSQINDLYKYNSDKSIFSSKAFGIADDSLKAMVDPLGRRLDPVSSALAVADARQELFQSLSRWEKEQLAKGLKLDPESASEFIAQKTKELSERIVSRTSIGAPAPTTPTPAVPGAQPQQQGAAKPSQPGSVADNINLNLPEMNPRDRNGPWANTPWELGQNMQMSVGEISLLRTSPNLKEPQSGVPYWQAFESKYGRGSAYFFINNRPEALKSKLEELRAQGRITK